MIISYEANTPAEAWRYNLKQIASHGVYVDNTKTIDGVIISQIKNPTDLVEKNPVYSQGFINEYKVQFLNPDNKGFEYTYGNRLCNYNSGHNGINQIEYIINDLKRDKNSRRAMGNTWQPWVDEFRKDVPCLQLVKCRLLKNRLHMEVVFRSHDMLLGYYPNVLGLSYLMDYIAEKLNAQKGTLTVVSLSPHVYKTDGDVFRSIAKVNL